MQPATPANERLRIAIHGAVQGVGFRPFIHRLAAELALAGWVQNSAQGVLVEVEGPRARLEEFLLRVGREKPPRSFIQGLEPTWLDAAGLAAFEIRESADTGAKTALVLPDIATCDDCVREIFDPRDRRHLYPFTNCTNCGPRFSIIEALPYDRARTAMKKFAMCPACRAEYDDPRDRRFHAQPNACPQCGPQLALWNAQGRVLAARHEALLAAAAAVREGKIVAVKGLGGFHLMCDARNGDAVARLRERKHREEKPLAVMVSSPESARALCEVSPLEARLLSSPEAPIVLLEKIAAHGEQSGISSAVASGNPSLGLLLPYTPLHHLLMCELGFPVVATSGNLSDEPICTDEHDALKRLGGIADLFLVHDRPIVRHVDDSVVRVTLGRELVLRRARGFAPLPVTIRNPQSAIRNPTVLAVGAHLKNTVTLAVNGQAFISQHIGDLETAESLAAFERVTGDFEKLYDARPEIVAADLHPDYLSTKWAASHTPPGSLRRVQHHFAHVLSCMAENEIAPPALGVSWDGTGFGTDGTVWGGEFLRVTDGGWERFAHLRTFPLPGGEKAVREPRRCALGLLHAAFGEVCPEPRKLEVPWGFSGMELAALKNMLAKNVNAPLTSSAGRLFDAVASLAGLRQVSRFEGQAAMELEWAARGAQTEEAYEFQIADCGLRNSPGAPPSLVADWLPLVREIVADVSNNVSQGVIAAKFHNALAALIVAIARRCGDERVVLTGGCFQNRLLTERAVGELRRAGFRPCWHQRVPPNDGGISLGQVVAALRGCG